MNIYNISNISNISAPLSCETIFNGIVVSCEQIDYPSSSLAAFHTQSRPQQINKRNRLFTECCQLYTKKQRITTWKQRWNKKALNKYSCSPSTSSFSNRITSVELLRLLLDEDIKRYGYLLFYHRTTSCPIIQKWMEIYTSMMDKALKDIFTTTSTTILHGFLSLVFLYPFPPNDRYSWIKKNVLSWTLFNKTKNQKIDAIRSDFKSFWSAYFFTNCFKSLQRKQQQQIKTFLSSTNTNTNESFLTIYNSLHANPNMKIIHQDLFFFLFEDLKNHVLIQKFKDYWCQRVIHYMKYILLPKITRKSNDQLVPMKSSPSPSIPTSFPSSSLSSSLSTPSRSLRSLREYVFQKETQRYRKNNPFQEDPQHTFKSSQIVKKVMTEWSQQQRQALRKQIQNKEKPKFQLDYPQLINALLVSNT